MTATYNLCNLFRKDTAANVAVNPKIHKVEISHIISYKENDGIFEYKSFKNIESDSLDTFNKEKEKYINDYQELNKSIYNSLNNTECDYISINDTMILKKSDFVNAKIAVAYK